MSAKVAGQARGSRVLSSASSSALIGRNRPSASANDIAENKGVERKPKSGDLGIGKTGDLQCTINHFAGGMIRRPRRVVAEVQMEEAWMTVGKISVRFGNLA